jgi:hypothetical protein
VGPRHGVLPEAFGVSKKRRIQSTEVEPMHFSLADKSREICNAWGSAARRVVAALGCIFLLKLVPAWAEQPFVVINGDAKNTAWWVLAEFHPFTTEVRGIPATQIRKTWCKATEIRKDLLPKELLVENNVDVMDDANLSFAIVGHFDGTAANQTALVGVYEECSGKKGRFILVLDQLAGGKSKIRFVSATPTEHQFGVLKKGDRNTIVTWSCMECDARSVLKWDRKKRKFDWLPDEND